DRLRGIGLHEGWRAFTRAPLLSLPVPPAFRNRIDGGAAARGGPFRVDARASPILRAAAEHDDDDVFGKVAVLSLQIPRRLVEIPQQRAADLRLDDAPQVPKDREVKRLKLRGEEMGERALDDDVLTDPDRGIAARHRNDGRRG